MVISGATLRDHNWHRGGYGEITVRQGFEVSSNISKYWIAKKAFGNETAFAEAMGRLGYAVEDTTLVYNSIGYGIPVTPLQNLTFYNALAKENSVVADSVRSALESAVYEGLAIPAQAENVRVAGATGTARFVDDSYAVEFCGYFPADNPKYSIIVTLNKPELPVSGGLMAGDVFRRIVNYVAHVFSCNNIDNIEKKELANEVFVECKETDSLIILYPDYSSINLICDSMPSKKDESVLLVAAACFTGQCLEEFNHFNIAGDHISSGVRYHGYPCKRNTGAFIYYERKWKFLYDNYTAEMDVAAQKVNVPQTATRQLTA